MPLLKSVEPATSVPEGWKVLGGPDLEASVELTFAVKLLNLFIFIADSVILDKVIRDEGRTTLFSLLSGVLTSILDKYVLHWMGGDAFDEGIMGFVKVVAVCCSVLTPSLTSMSLRTTSPPISLGSTKALTQVDTQRIGASRCRSFTLQVPSLRSQKTTSVFWAFYSSVLRVKFW